MLKSLVYKAMITVLVISVIAPFFMRDQYGLPLMTVSDLKMPAWVPDSRAVTAAVEGVSELVASADEDEVRESSTVEVYRWQDEQGNWHFSSRDSAAGKSRAVVVEADRNVMDSDPSAVNVEEQQQTSSYEFSEEALRAPLLHAGETLDKARRAREMMEARAQQAEGI